MNIEKNLSQILPTKRIERVIGKKKEYYLKKYSSGKKLATLIINFKLDNADTYRLSHLFYLLDFIHYFYEDLFDVLLVEQCETPLFTHHLKKLKPYVRYEHLYNPNNFNRGWGYNVAVKQFCPESKVVVLMDTDILLGHNFLSAVRDCYIEKYDVISPYQNVYYTSEKESIEIKKGFHFDSLTDLEKIKNPVTITGGIVIFDKTFYMSIKGYEQYVGYGSEDRALDVTILNFLDQKRIQIGNIAYPHLWHPTDKKARTNWSEIYSHLTTNYKCEWHKNLKPNEFIHANCSHCDKETNLKLIIKKSKSFGDPLLYKNKITINGVSPILEHTLPESIIIPPDLEKKGLENVGKREKYKAPNPDSNELSQFHNQFLGKRCFIIGNGPSLNKHDLTFLEDEYTFGVNSFYYKTRETGFRPYFYVVEDSSVMKENIEEIKNYYAPFKFFPTIYKNIHPKEPNTFFFTMNRGFYDKSSPNYVVPRFSTDITKELYCGQSVTYINLQLAFFMGFTEVYLIGMDFSYDIPKSHKRNGDVLLSDTDDNNHFHKDYFGKGKTWKDPKLERVAMNYKMAKLVYDCVGRKIYNATVGGSLEIFERVEYNQLFKQKDTNNNMGSNIESSSSPLFKNANEFYRNKNYIKALDIYVSLVDANPDFNLYKQATINCYIKAKDLKKKIDNGINRKVREIIEHM